MTKNPGELKVKMLKIIFLIGGVLAIAGCQTQTRNGLQSTLVFDASAPVEQGKMRFGMKNPDPEKWQALTPGTATGRFRCRELACPYPSAVIVDVVRSPTRSPDRIALQRLADAAVQPATGLAPMGALVSRERVSGRVTQIKGYPAVVREIKIVTAEGRTLYNHVQVIFANFLAITLTGSSQDRAFAAKIVQDFTAEINIEEGPRT